MKVSSDDKLTMLGGVINPVMSALAGASNSDEVSPDDAIDFFVMGIAAILDNDTALTTPLLRKKALKSVADLVEQRYAHMRMLRANSGGMGWLASVFDAAPDRVN